jgi:YbbR domain-containing protein
MTKQLVISANSSGTVANGYALGDVSISGSNVLRVSGPASVVGEVASAVATINVEGVSTNLSDTVVPMLYSDQGAEIDTTKLSLNMTTVTISATVLGTKEVPVNFSAVGSPGADYEIVGITSDPETILLKGSAGALNGAISIEVPADLLDVTNLTENLVTTIDISEYLPDGCEPVNKGQTVIPVTVWIEQYTTKTFTIPVSYITVDGLADDLNLSYAENTVEVTLGGLSSQLDEVESSSLRFVMDVSGLTPGSHSVNLSFKETQENPDLLDAQVDIVISENSDDEENE